MWRASVVGLLVALCTLGATVAGPASAAPPDGSDTGPVTPVTLPLIPVPTGCTAPPMPHIVFVGTIDKRDYRTVRFEIERIRSGRGAPFASGNLIDVRFGLDAQYLDDDETYLVSAVVDPDLGFLVSRVSEPIEDFGGDEVIGVSETDVNCPIYEDPMRTLHLDGTPIETSVLQPFFDAKVRIVGAFLLPFLVALGVIFLLATFRLSVSGLYRGIVDGGRRHAR